MSGRRISQVDESTGEVVGSFVAVIRPKQKSSFQRHFTMNQDALMILVQNLKGEELRVFMMLLSELDYENYIQIQQTDIASKLDMQKQNVNRSIKRLLEIGVINEGPKIGRSRTYNLNASFGWKGTVTNHRKALKNGLCVIDGGLSR